jgi:hypothetical protein
VTCSGTGWRRACSPTFTSTSGGTCASGSSWGSCDSRQHVCYKSLPRIHYSYAQAPFYRLQIAAARARAAGRPGRALPASRDAGGVAELARHTLRACSGTLLCGRHTRLAGLALQRGS